MATSSDNLGPLPLGDRQEIQEQASLRALLNCLPEEKILFRLLKADDKGVDGTLEAKVEVRLPAKGGGEEIKYKFTNCVAQAQIKSTDRDELNADGSVSYSIGTSNLNYLLNGQSPIYFLWIALTGQVRYAWARDEWRRLDAELPEWVNQASFTIRFRNVVDAAAVDAIRDRIIREAQFEREIHETLARSAPLTDSVTMGIDPTTLNTTDPRTLYEHLLSSGMTLVSGGHGWQVLEWYDLLNADARNEARVRLVAAFAEASLGKYFAAVGHLAAAAVRRSELSEADSQFLDYLRGVCDYQTGRIDLQEYVRRERDRAARLSGAHAAAHALEALRQEQLREKDTQRRLALLDEMRGKATEILTAPDSSTANKLQAQILILSAEGEALACRFIDDISHIQTRQAIGQPTAGMARQATQVTAPLWRAWEAEAERIVHEATEFGFPLLLADALTVRLSVFRGVMQFQQLDSVWNGRPFTVSATQLAPLMKDAEQAMELYATAGSLEGETRSKLLLADLFDFQGQRAAAKSLAEGALVVAEAMMYPRLISLAREHIDGQTTLLQFMAKVKDRKAADEDILLAKETDETLKGTARHALNSLRLPLDYLPVLEREWVYYRLIAQERVGWCRHLDLLQGPKYSLPPSSCYLADPPRACRCEKHGYQQRIECPDGETAVTAFKRAFCDGCPDREPKGGSRT